jgi:hypothetical protein
MSRTTVTELPVLGLIGRETGQYIEQKLFHALFSNSLG